MSQAALSPIRLHPARLAILEVEPPGGPVLAAGVLLLDPERDRIYVRLRRDWETIAPDQAEVLKSMEQGLAGLAGELGAARLFDYLQDTLSNVIQMREPAEVMVEDFERALARYYRKHVPTTVRPFVTHLPRYSLAVAAGKFLENREVEEEGWEEAPADLKLMPGMFVARIAGESMEPRIPDGSLCVFRGPLVGSRLVGSRQGKLVLVEALGRGTNDRYTVKRYRSQKVQNPDGSWTHDRIRLEPLNPTFEAWDLPPEEDRYRIFAEFVMVLD
jgi:SOS-response transcriptional repressor LexA